MSRLRSARVSCIGASGTGRMRGHRTFQRSSCRLALAASLAVACCSLQAAAQDYPNRPVRIVTSPPGGGNDFPARILAKGLSAALNQQVLIDNRPTIVTGEVVAKSPPDGYTLLVSGTPLWIGPLVEKTSYDPIADFAPISVLDRAAVLLVVHPSMPVKSVKDLIALARSRPGALNYSSGANGASNHLGGVLFNHLAQVNIVRIPYKGTAPAMTAVMTGEVQLMFPGVGGAAPHVKSGRLRALAVGSAEPSTFLPDVPTLDASGVSGYSCVTLHALFAPAATPAPILTRLEQETVRFIRSAEARDMMMKGGVEAVSSSPQELSAIMKTEMTTIGKILRDAGIGPP